MDNGLTVIVHEDFTTPLVAVNILYKVGSRDEDPDKTGFTHLFEHLMFGGSKNVPEFDDVIQEAGGENNAFTNTDITNFYDIVPVQNLDVVLWLESDRMNQLKFNKSVLDTQKRVVIEEFKETCLNEPYGDMWHHLAAMAFEKHPYRWPTIGIDFHHIASAHMDDVKSFFYNYYRPNNAILVLAGPVKTDEVLKKVQYWFGSIPAGDTVRPIRQMDQPYQSYKQKTVEADVPMNAIIMAFQMDARRTRGYYDLDLVSDILSSGRSSRLQQNLVKDRQLFNSIDAFVLGTEDPGLFLVEGKLMDGVSLETGRAAIWEELYRLSNEALDPQEMEKLLNRAESQLIFSEYSVVNKSMNLAYFESIGDIDLINQEAKIYSAITPDELQKSSATCFRDQAYVELNYIPNASKVG